MIDREFFYFGRTLNQQPVSTRKPRRILAQRYEPWMLEAVIKWIRDGWSLNSFPSRHDVSCNTWTRLLRDTPELQPVKHEYLSKLPYYPHSKMQKIKEAHGSAL